MLWKSPVVLMFFWCVTLSLFTVTVSDGAGTLAGALGEAVPEPGPVPAAGDGSSESRQFSTAPSVTNVTTSSVSPTAMTTAAPKSREATTTSHPSSAVIFGDDAKPHLNPSNMTEEVFNFIDEEEAPQDALTLALYMLASVLVVLAICMIFSYCKSKLFLSSHGTYTPVYTDSMDDTNTWICGDDINKSLRLFAPSCYPIPGLW